MKLKVKIQVLVARNCWGTNAIPKLPQREVETSTDVDVDNTNLELSSFWLHEAYMVSENSGQRRSLNSNNIIDIIPMPPTKKSWQFKYKSVETY